MNIEQLNEIIDSYKWIKVKQIKTVWSKGIGDDNKYQELLNHHIEETEFLISKCRELATELLELKKNNKL